MVRSDYSTSSTENSDGADPASDSYADESDLPPYNNSNNYHNNSGNGGGGIGSSHTGGGGNKDVNSSSYRNSNNNKKSSSQQQHHLSISGLNRRLRTEYIDVDPNDDSFAASLIRGIVGLVGSCFTPRQILVALRLLKAITVAFIALTAAANVVYISCNEFVANNNNNNNHYFGHRRDTILRLYGLGFAVLALLIELDKFVMKNFKVLKGFLARFGMLFFVATVTYCHPAQLNNGGAASGVPPSAVVFQMVASMVL